MTLRVIIAGGYTGGHVECALAIARGLEQARPGAEILLCGARGGPEVAAGRAAGYPVATVWIQGIDRRRSARGLVRNLLLPLQLVVSGHQANGIVSRFAPGIVVGVGAFASAPVVAAAQRAGVATVLHEANARPGVANRLLARRASVVCLGVDEAASWFPRARTVVTGNPVRRLDGGPAAEARVRLGLDPRTPTLLVLGGSLGSPALNRWVTSRRDALAGLGLQLLWQCGPAHLRACAPAAGPRVRVVPFIDDMAAAYAAADVVVTAAGALTLAELCDLGKAAVLVPARGVAEDHQLDNVVGLARRGLAVARQDDEILPAVTALARDPERRRVLGQRMRELARPDAARRIVDEILRLETR